MVTYKIPASLIEEFLKVSATNLNVEKKSHVETLAFLMGYYANDVLIGTHLVFPSQRGQSWKVDDEGK